MNTLNDILKDTLDRALGAVYEGVVFDTAGLAKMLIPCVIVLAAALLIDLLLKCFRELRRYSYMVVTAALIALIAASAFIPATLVQAGDSASNWLHERFFAVEEQMPQDGETGTGGAS